MTDKPTTSVQIKAKSDPEALLNDLSTSLKSFQSTVRAWTAVETDLPKTSGNNNLSGSDTMRQARLGLGAKPQRQTVAGDSVTANIALKNQLTNDNNRHNQNGQNGQTSQKQNIKFNKFNNIQKNYNLSKVTKPTGKKRNDSDDEDNGRGKASLIKSKHKK